MISEPERWEGYGILPSSNQLIETNDKEFQIAVEDSNVSTKHMKRLFAKQTQISLSE